MKILITGADGQLGSELQACTPAGMELDASDVRDLDICDASAVKDRVASFAPDWVVNCAAYTAVDRAEEEPDIAQAINATGAGNLAVAARESGARMLHVSTDFIFNGAQGKPYQPGDVPGPLGVYGASKLAGEEHVRAEIAERCVIIRTAWVYSVYGSNFVKTMLRLMNERDSLSVVCDQIGTPTWTGNFARAIWQAIENQLSAGVYHWTDLGACSWYDFAVAIQEEALQCGLLNEQIPVSPIMSKDYPTLARRPHYSVMDTSALRNALELPGQHWRAALREMLAVLQEQDTP